jgi:hypothetical protein
MKSPFKTTLLAVVAGSAAFSTIVGMQSANAQGIPEANFAEACNASGTISAVGSIFEFLAFQNDDKNENKGCLLGDKLFKLTETTLLRLPTTLISLSKIDDLIYTILVQDANGFQNGATFAYTATITDPNIGQDGFSLVSADASSSIPLTSQQNWSVTTSGPDFGPIVSTHLTSALELPLNLTQPTLTVKNLVTKSTKGPQQITNSIVQKVARGPSEVPGPIPLLGAAAAFGFSRKLRARIKVMA